MPTRSSARSRQAGWARCIARAIESSNATSRSRRCPASSPAIRLASTAALSARISPAFMPITVGERLAHEITALIGKGGMGEVYRAHDTTLKRDVAIKTLPAEFSHDPDRLSRFQREAEARVVESSQHRRDLRARGGRRNRCLILELVEGDTRRRDRDSRRASACRGASHRPTDLRRARGRARQGHRPSRSEAGQRQGDARRHGQGARLRLAKAFDSALSHRRCRCRPRWESPQRTPADSRHGRLHVTRASQGSCCDRRSDIFAFGCVLYEMLTGRQTFGGEDVAEVLGRVVTGEPDWSRLPAGTPHAVRRVLQRALKKDPRQRLGDIRDARLDLEEGGTGIGGASRHEIPEKILAGVGRLRGCRTLALTLSVPAMTHFREARPAEVRLEINTPFTPAPLHFALSPDGRHIVFVASVDGPQRLWLRALDKTDAQPLTGTDGAEYPFWSKDSRSIGFFASGKLLRIDLGGPSRSRSPTPPPAAAAPGTPMARSFSPTASSSPLLRSRLGW